jgi:hypothetical protein
MTGFGFLRYFVNKVHPYEGQYILAQLVALSSVSDDTASLITFYRFARLVSTLTTTSSVHANFIPNLQAFLM